MYSKQTDRLLGRGHLASRPYLQRMLRSYQDHGSSFRRGSRLWRAAVKPGPQTINAAGQITEPNVRGFIATEILPLLWVFGKMLSTLHADSMHEIYGYFQTLIASTHLICSGNRSRRSLGQGAPQDSFVSIKLVDSISTAC